MGIIKPKENLKLDSKLLVGAVVRLIKQNIFNEFMKTNELSDANQEFCDKIGWYPIDELPMKKEFIKELKEIEKGPHFEMTLEELDELMGTK